MQRHVAGGIFFRSVKGKEKAPTFRRGKKFLSCFVGSEERVDFYISAAIQIKEFTFGCLNDGQSSHTAVIKVNDFCATAVAEPDPTSVNRLQKFFREGDDEARVEFAGECVAVEDFDYVEGRISFGVGAVRGHGVREFT